MTPDEVLALVTASPLRLSRAEFNKMLDPQRRVGVPEAVIDLACRVCIAVQIMYLANGFPAPREPEEIAEFLDILSDAEVKEVVSIAESFEIAEMH
jgi:hypothetical protein